MEAVNAILAGEAGDEGLADQRTIDCVLAGLLLGQRAKSPAQDHSAVRNVLHARQRQFGTFLEGLHVAIGDGKIGIRRQREAMTQRPHRGDKPAVIGCARDFIARAVKSRPWHPRNGTKLA